MKSKMKMHREQGIGRREFLVVSSTCALATAVIGPKAFAGDAAAPAKRLAVGFVAFGEPSTLASAASIPSGDGAFIARGARVWMCAASGSVSAGGRRGVELLTHYSYLDGAERRDAPFRAWASGRNGSDAQSIAFSVPVDETQKIDFSVAIERPVSQTGGTRSRRRAVGGAKTTQLDHLPLSLTLLSGEGLKLARGYYVIVPLLEDEREPRWSSYAMHTTDGRPRVVDLFGEPAPFEHFVLSIDYATL